MFDPIMNYIINLPEMAEAFLKGFNFGLKVKTGREMVSSFQLTQNAPLTFNVPSEGFLSAISLCPTPVTAQSHFLECEVRLIDHRGNLLLAHTLPLTESLTTLDFQEYSLEIGAATQLQLTLHNKTPWPLLDPTGRAVVDIQWNKTLLLKELVILCKNAATSELIFQESLWFEAPITTVVDAPTIWGYDTNKTTHTLSFKPGDPDITTLEFFYDQNTEGRLIRANYINEDGVIFQYEDIIVLPAEFNTHYTVVAPAFSGRRLLSTDTFTFQINKHSPHITYADFFYTKER